ncbi:MAG: xanthine dehydrogenase family protein molybdopterin-binding subunit [Microthrixaceae bacterium]
MSILGNRVRRIEDPKLLVGAGTFLDDLDDPLLEGKLSVAFVRSYFAHGELLGIDVSDAISMPGVCGVFTAADLDLVLPRPGGARAPKEMARPWLPIEWVRFVGEPVAVVVAETTAQAVDAAEMVMVDIEPLPAVVGIDAGFSDAELLFPSVGTNRNSLMDDGWNAWGDERADDDDPFFADCDVVVRERIENPRVAGVSIEGRGSAAAFVDGRLHQWISSQNVHGARAAIAAAHGLEPDSVHVLTPDVGGGFGPKINPSPEDVIVGWVARHLGRPAAWVETRSENLTAQSHGRGHSHHIAIGGSRDGRIKALEIDMRADAGAYPLLGAFLPYFTRLMAAGVYDIERIRTRAEATVTSSVPTEAYRGAGRPEATTTLERAVDLFAAECGLDPVEARRRNLIPAFSEPHHTAAGATYDCGDYEKALDAALAEADYEALRDQQARRRSKGATRALGIGVSTYVEITGAGVTSEWGEVSISADDSVPGGAAVEVLTGSSPHGQGLHTALAMIVSERMGVPIEAVNVAHGDTDRVPEGMGTMGSRSLQMGGSAISEAARQVHDQARELAAAELEANPDDVAFNAEAGGFCVVGTPAMTVSWSRVLNRAEGSRISVGDKFNTDGLTYPNGAHVAVVEVDLETGLVDLLRLVAADDAGVILNPMLAEGQRHGGIAQGASQALFEAARFDHDGNPLTATLADYGIPSAADLPPWDLVDVATPTPMNELGAKGIGESGTIGATPAVHSAVVDALSHLGVRHLDMPLSPERVWAAVGAATVASSATGTDDRSTT